MLALWLRGMLRSLASAITRQPPKPVWSAPTLSLRSSLHDLPVWVLGECADHQHTHVVIAHHSRVPASNRQYLISLQDAEMKINLGASVRQGRICDRDLRLLNVLKLTTGLVKVIRW